MSDPLLAVEDLRTHLHVDGDVVRAVDGLSFEVRPGETVCLVGESGSGKTLACDAITGLVGPPAETSGTVRFDGMDLLSMAEPALRELRGDRIAYVFQNAQSALDPVYTVGDQIVEAIAFHRDVDDGEVRERATELLRTVGLSRAGERIDSYPHELSDGMCQRVAIAIALAAEPDLLIADEPTSSLDVLTQGRIIDLLAELEREREFATLLVTHDLRVVAALAERVVVTYGGRGVERGPVTAVFDRPAHPYTQDLFGSFGGDRSESPRASVPESGCPYRRECPHAIEACREPALPFESVDDDGRHRAACVFYEPERDETTVLPPEGEAPIDEDDFAGGVDGTGDGGRSDDIARGGDDG